MSNPVCHLTGQEKFASHDELTLEVVRTLESGPQRRLWLLRCTDCGQCYLKAYEQLEDWADGGGKVQVRYRPISSAQVREVDLSLTLAWDLVHSQPFLLWDEQGQLDWIL